MCRFTNIFVFFVCFLHCVCIQAQQGTPCETPDNRRGLCVSIYDCKLVKDLLSRAVSAETRNFVRGLQCGYRDNSPYVCCPQQTTREVTPPDETPDKTTDNLQEDFTGKFLSPPACGSSNASLPKVVGGIPAALGEFPWMAALGYRNKGNPNGPPKWLCGGTLITNKHILTAAHCVHNRPDLYVARLGELDLYEDNDGASPTDIQIANAKIHEEYSNTKYVNDIAILTLAQSTENLVSVWPICLPWQPDKRTKSYLGFTPFIIGWGAVYFQGPSSSVLQVASIPVLDNIKCQTAYEGKSIIDERILCAGHPQGKVDACQGDSGGPLMYGNVSPGSKLFQFYLIGVVSYGIRCADVQYPGVYSRVTHFLPWIAKNIN